MAKKRLTKDQKLRRERLMTVGKWTGLGLLTYELYVVLVLRRQHRRDAFNAALNAKRATNKQLMVIGDPDGSFVNRVMGRDFDCADECVDPKGCPSCSNVVVADPVTALQKCANNSYVIFVNAGYFEQAKDADAFMGELKRVSGGDIFMSYREPWSLSAFSPFMKRRVKAAPPLAPFVEWSPLPWAKETKGTHKLALKGFGHVLTPGGW